MGVTVLITVLGGFLSLRLLPLALGNRVELECVFSGRDLSDSGVSWMLQHRQSVPQFILFITSLGRVAPTENGKPPTRFEAKRESSIYRLTVKSFQEQDQGNYYCIVNHNQRLYFSSGIPLHLPGQHQPHPISAPSAWTPPTTAPSTKATTTQPSTTSAKATEKGLDLSCHLYIWVPLAIACLLLLIALLATITMCQSKRRCKCKRLVNFHLGTFSL
uniref:T-cell surface glycoprotein CD8 alpha chain n=1 Tax=Gopherus agassizii TaxID=38772 RepID=A0A452IID2_9SAUR